MANLKIQFFDGFTSETTPNSVIASGPSGDIIWRGTWVSGNYTINDAVSYNGSSYVCHTSTISNDLPTDITYWNVLASKGDTGATGDSGATGQGVPIGGTAGQVLSKIDGTDYNTEWVTSSGYVSGPASAVSGNVVTFDGITGKLIQDSGLTLSGTNTGDQVASGVTYTDTYFTGASEVQSAIDNNFVLASGAATLADGLETSLNGGTTGQVLTKDSATDGDYSWATPSGGGGSVYTSAQYYDGTGGTSVNATTYVTIPMATADFEDADYSNTAGVVTITDAGRYDIDAFVGINGTTSNYRWTGSIAIYKNGSTLLKELSGGYIRATSGSNDTSLAINHVVTLAASDTIEIKVKRISTVTGNATTNANNNQLRLTRLT